jgi:CRISPR/Cas system CSM-associated protein Csm2 small subunit
MTYSYSFDRKTDKWETLADTFDTMLDELAEVKSDADEMADIFLAVDNFDIDEVL